MKSDFKLMAEEKKESDENIQRYKLGYRPNVLPPEESKEVDARHPMEKAFRRGKL